MNTALSYSLQPPTVFVASNTTMILVAQNPLGNPPVTLVGGPDGDEIDIYFPIGGSSTDLVNTLDFDVTAVTQGYTCAKSVSGDFFSLRAPGGATLLQGDQITVQFSSVVINGVQGNATVTVTELIGEPPPVPPTFSISISKLPQTLNIIAWLDNLIVGAGQSSNLLWQSMGGTRVEVAGFSTGTGVKTFPVVGDPPYPGTCTVTVDKTESQRTYTVTVYTSDGQHTQTPVTLTQHSPLITKFVSDKSGTLGVFDNVMLDWTVLFASRITLQEPGLTIQNPKPPYQVSPGRDVLSACGGNYPAMAGTATYTLGASGYTVPDTKSLSFNLAPVGLSYFKFRDMAADGTLSMVVFATDPLNWPANNLNLNTNPMTFTIFQPGGTSNVYYLGSGDTVHPQIQYFNAKDVGNGQFEFSWVTANLASLVLNPGNINIDAASIQKGTKTISVSASTYVLNAVGKNGQSISSTLAVPRSSGGTIFSTTGKPVEVKVGISVIHGGPIPNYHKPSVENITEAKGLIAHLTFANIWALPAVPISGKTVRLESKGNIAGGGRLWHICINGLAGNNTFAAVTIHGNVAKEPTAARKTQAELDVRKALLDSIASREMLIVDDHSTK